MLPGQVFIFKLDRFVNGLIARHTQTRPNLELKTLFNALSRRCCSLFGN